MYAVQSNLFNFQGDCSLVYSPQWPPQCGGWPRQVIILYHSRKRLNSCGQFIADIRGARVRELEEKRINKEMANIRKKFKGAHACHAICRGLRLMVSKDGNLDGYQKKKYNSLLQTVRGLAEPPLQICGQNHLHVYSWVQSRRWAYGSRESHLQPEI